MGRDDSMMLQALLAAFTDTVDPDQLPRVHVTWLPPDPNAPTTYSPAGFAQFEVRAELRFYFPMEGPARD